MAINVLRGGMLTTVQDLGRRGYRAAGVPLSGAMDPFALRVANSLVGNAENDAALEFTLIGPDLEFTENALIAVTGVECEGVRSWRPLEIRAGERVQLRACVRGCRGYVAVSGGINVAPVLGSRSTYLRGQWGGYQGRALHDGDRLNVGESAAAPIIETHAQYTWQIDPRMLPAYAARPTIRVIRGAAAGEGCDRLLTTAYRVSPQSDRMGVRLVGGNAQMPSSGDLLSSAVVPGTIQLPPDGQPVILMADAQTIGGYPQIAHVICVDLPLVAQVRPGDQLRFVEVSFEEAHRLALARDRSVAMLREGLAEKLGHAPPNPAP